MKGILYGIGTGPGEPSAITQKALDVIKNCDVIALPNERKENCAAYKIVKQVLPEIDSKEYLLLDFPMTKDAEVLKKAHDSTAKKIVSILEENKNVAFLTIGDVTVYSTFIYIKNMVEENYGTVLINGVPSFCAAAARLGISLSEQEEEIHIIPGSKNLRDAFSLEGTLVFMKSGKKLSELKDFLLRQKNSFDFDFYAISNCGMEDEKIYSSIGEISDEASYFTTVIIKNIKRKNSDKNYKFFQNARCELFPCHKIDCEENFNCLFCFCPLYFLGDKCGGDFHYTDKGIKSCIDCNVPHKKENYELIKNKLMEANRHSIGS